MINSWVIRYCLNSLSYQFPYPPFEGDLVWGRFSNTSAGELFHSWKVLFKKEYSSMSVLCFLLLIIRPWSTLLRQWGRFSLSPTRFHARSPEYALNKAHIRDNSLRDVSFPIRVFCIVRKSGRLALHPVQCPHLTISIRIPARGSIFKNWPY